jgi:hypothetical protein
MRRYRAAAAALDARTSDAAVRTPSRMCAPRAAFVAATLSAWVSAGATFPALAAAQAAPPAEQEAAAPGGQAVPPAPVRVTTSVDPEQVTIGTPFRFTIRVEADAGVEVLLPVLSERLGDFEMTDFGRRDVPAAGRGGATTVELWYELRAYETGAQFVPSVPIAYRAGAGEPVRIESPRVVIDVASVLAKLPARPAADDSAPGGATAAAPDAPGGDASAAAGAAHDVPDIEPAVPIRAPATWTWLAAAASAALALLALAVWLGRRRRVALGAAQARPAHEAALEALARLRDERLVEHGELERYYVALSDVVRRYLEARFALRAPEMTTDEFLAAAQRSRELTSAQRAALGDFLAEADLVKFARLVPTRERAERAWTAAHDFVQSTRPREEDGRAAA